MKTCDHYACEENAEVCQFNWDNAKNSYYCAYHAPLYNSVKNRQKEIEKIAERLEASAIQTTVVKAAEDLRRLFPEPKLTLDDHYYAIAPQIQDVIDYIVENEKDLKDPPGSNGSNRGAFEGAHASLLNARGYVKMFCGKK